MDKADPDRTRILNRRAARARRSNWLRGLLFSLTGMALALGLRMNPEIVGEVVAWSHGVHTSATPGTLANPADVNVRVMPSDFVPVRRGGSMPGSGQTVPRDTTQADAEAVSAALRGFNPGG